MPLNPLCMFNWKCCTVERLSIWKSRGEVLSNKTTTPSDSIEKYCRGFIFPRKFHLVFYQSELSVWLARKSIKGKGRTEPVVQRFTRSPISILVGLSKFLFLLPPCLFDFSTIFFLESMLSLRISCLLDFLFVSSLISNRFRFFVYFEGFMVGFTYFYV